MPLEIGKLNVKISVNQAKPEGGEGSSMSPAEREMQSKNLAPEKLSKDIIEHVMNILENQKER